MGTSAGVFPDAKHQNDLHAVSHFIITKNHAVDVSIFVSQIRKPMCIESFNKDSNSRL